MATVIPFRGLLYSTSRVPDLKPVVAPPYDVISAAEARNYRARHPHNIVRIDLPEGDMGTRYGAAAAMLGKWQTDEVLVRDDRPAIYACSQRYALKGMPRRVRWGFIALLRIEEEGSGIVLPHERTMPTPRTDRVELSIASRAQISPIFLLYSDPQGSISGAIEALDARPPDRWVSDDGDAELRMWRVRDPETLRIVHEGLEKRKVWIADGHHRYEAAREARARLRAAGGASEGGERTYDYVMAYLSNIDSPGVAILPYHRVVRHLEDFSKTALEKGLEDRFDIKRFPFDGLDHRSEQIRRRLHEVANRGRLAFGLFTGGSAFELLLLKEEMPSPSPFESLPEPLRSLDSSILHMGIFDSILGITPELQQSGDHIRYTEDGDRAISWVDAGEGQAAFFMNPASKAQLMSVAEAGLTMPSKSTFFYPKMLTGIVVNPLEPFDEVCSVPHRVAAGGD